MPSHIPSIVIIGAGIGGLYAAYHLQHLGYKVTVVEASDYIGGRLKEHDSLYLKSGERYNVGGEILHGDGTILNYELKKLNATISPSFDIYAKPTEDNQPKLWFNGRLHDLYETEDITHMLELLKNIENNRPVKDISLLEYLKQNKLNPELFGIADSFYAKTQGIHKGSKLINKIIGSDLHRLGLALSAEQERMWNAGTSNFKLHEGYAPLVRHYAKGLNIKLNWQAKKIDYKKTPIKITNQKGQQLYADRVIVTVPLTVLKDGDIQFIPSLPSEKKVAIQKIRMDAAAKVICVFHTRFWPKKVGLVFSDDPLIPQFWMLHSKPGEYYVTALTTGEKAEKLSKLSDKKAIQHFVKLLDKIFATSQDETPASHAFLKGYVKDWSKAKFIRGGYSSAGLNAEGMREVLRKNVHEKVFFAGEATSTFYYSCVHGAMESAERAIHEVLMSLRKPKL